MFVARIDTENGELHGWIQAGRIDLFVWFEGAELSQVQLTVERDVAEWQAPARLSTGQTRESGAAGKRSELIDFDRRTRPDLIDSIRKAVAVSELPAEAIGLVELLLSTPASPSIAAATKPVESLVRAAQKTAAK